MENEILNFILLAPLAFAVSIIGFGFACNLLFDFYAKLKDKNLYESQNYATNFEMQMVKIHNEELEQRIKRLEHKVNELSKSA